MGLPKGLSMRNGLGVLSCLIIAMSPALAWSQTEAPSPTKEMKVAPEKSIDETSQPLATSAPEQNEPVDDIGWKNRSIPQNGMTISLGSLIGATSTYKTTGGGLNSSRTERDKSDFIFGVEFRKSVYKSIGIGLAVEAFNYNYSDGTPSDRMRQVFIIVRGENRISDTNWYTWGGVGLGAAMIDLGQIGVTSGSTTIRANNSTYTGAFFTPRVGLDYVVSEKLFFGASLNYGFTNFIADSSAYNGSGTKTNSYNIETSRDWYSVALTVGLGF